MATLFKNPQLTDYFVTCDKVECITEPYENAKVLLFPNLGLNIRHNFWARLPVDQYAILRKLKTTAGGLAVLEKQFAQAGLPEALARKLHDEIRAITDAVVPLYITMFKGYTFEIERMVWRLNMTQNENMHIDLGEAEAHLARLFINLDNQPRIWRTGYTIEEIIARHPEALPPNVTHWHARGALNSVVYGAAHEWWNLAPSHVAYFAPGDAWAVDSRQVAHQIFYGRRALSVDFFVKRESLRDPSRHILSILERHGYKPPTPLPR